MNLQEALKLAKLATSKDSPNLKLKSKDGIVSVSARKQAFHIEARAECANELNCAVDANKIIGAVAKFGESITQDGDTVKLKQGRSRATIHATDASAFPDAPSLSDEFVDIPGDIIDMISRVSFAAAKDDVRAFLNGVYIETKGGVAYAVATNGQRMAWLERGIDSDVETSFIMSIDAISALVAVSPESLSIGHIAHGDSGDASISIMPIDGKYAPWRKVIPEPCNKIEIDKAVILDALQKISVVSNDRLQVGAISFNPESIVLSSNLPDGSEAVAEVDADSPEQMDIGINVKYLAEAISSMSGDTVYIDYSDPKKAIHFTDGDLNVIVMPVVL